MEIKNQQLQVGFDKWEENKVNKSLAKFPERKEKFEFDTGEEVRRLYTPLDVETDYQKDLGYPEFSSIQEVFNLLCIEENSGL